MLTNLMIALGFIFLYFALYCLIDFIDIKYKGNPIKRGAHCVVTLLVKDVDENIEYVIRTLKTLCTEELTICDKIFIIDMDSIDHTVGILEKISYLDDRIEVLTLNDKEKIFKILNLKEGEIVE